MKKILAPLFAALLVVLALLSASTPRAFAETRRDEVITSSTDAVGSIASIITAVSGKKIVVKSMILASSSAGVLSFRDGASGNWLASVYLAANTTYTFDDKVLGDGFKTTAGNALYADGEGTLTATFRIHRE
jgi:hypothetical protein